MRAGRLGIPGLKSGTRGTQFLSPQTWPRIIKGRPFRVSCGCCAEADIPFYRTRRVLISKNMSMLSARLESRPRKKHKCRLNKANRNYAQLFRCVAVSINGSIARQEKNNESSIRRVFCRIRISISSEFVWPSSLGLWSQGCQFRCKAGQSPASAYTTGTRKVADLLDP